MHSVSRTEVEDEQRFVERACDSTREQGKYAIGAIGNTPILTRLVSTIDKQLQRLGTNMQASPER